MLSEIVFALSLLHLQLYYCGSKANSLLAIRSFFSNNWQRGTHNRSWVDKTRSTATPKLFKFIKAPVNIYVALLILWGTTHPIWNHTSSRSVQLGLLKRVKRMSVPCWYLGRTGNANSENRACECRNTNVDYCRPKVYGPFDQVPCQWLAMGSVESPLRKWSYRRPHGFQSNPWCQFHQRNLHRWHWHSHFVVPMHDSKRLRKASYETKQVPPAWDFVEDLYWKAPQFANWANTTPSRSSTVYPWVTLNNNISERSRTMRR